MCYYSSKFGARVVEVLTVLLHEGARVVEVLTVILHEGARVVEVLTVLLYEGTRVVEDELMEGVALSVQMGFPTQAGGLEVGEALQGSKGRQALIHRNRRACHCTQHNNNKLVVVSKIVYHSVEYSTIV